MLRRGALGAGAGIAAVGGGAALAPAPALAAVVGPWTHVAPGESIQAAVAAGARTIVLGDGTYPVTAPIVAVNGLVIRGVGQRTRLVATAAVPAMIQIGGGGPVDAVEISDLVLDCNDLAVTAIDLHIVGTTGNYQGEPDSVCRLDNLRIHDPTQDGVVYRGTDTQACVTSRVRVRRATRYGFRVESPDNWWSECEATTRGSGAGFFLGATAANNFFQACKAWYCRQYGFHVRANRNKFVGCEAQDTAGHGWFIEWDRNVFTACVADTAGMYDVGGTPGTADGFYVVDGLNTSLVGCQAFDRQPGGHQAQQRYGFSVPASMVTGGRLVAPTGWGNTAGLVQQR